MNTAWPEGMGQLTKVLTSAATLDSVPARLGNGQGVEEIGHNLARERPKFRAQFSARMKQGLGTILWAIDENMGTNLQAVTSIFTSIFTSAV